MLTESHENPSRDDRIREVVMEFRQQLAAGKGCDLEALVRQHNDLSDELRPILKAIEATEPFFSTAESEDLIVEDGESTDSAILTVRWQSEADEDSSLSDITRTHAPGSGSSAIGGNRDPRRSLPAGTLVGNYRLIRPLGRGGMGEVYAAEEATSGRPFALKLLSSVLPRSSDTVERFLNEASLAAKLSHPRTTFVYGAGQEGGQFYIAMELMPGHTLKDLVETKGPLPVTEAVDFMLDVLSGLEAAHSIGVIHRDLKPSNCFIDKDGRIKVGDFGLAKSLVANADITQTGTFLGTPQFAAPEQIRRADIDQRTDIFAVGATLYYLLTGKPPFTGDPAAVIAQIVADTPTRVRKLRPEVPKSLERIIQRCLSKSPGQRFRSAVEVRRALLPFSTDGVSMSDVGRRIAAFALDLVVMFGLMIGVSILYGATYLTMRFAQSPILFQPMFGFLANMSIGSIFYFAFCDAIWGTTPGKKWLGIRVVNSFGESPGFWQSLLRAVIFPGLFFTTVDVGQSLLSEWPLFNDFSRTAVPLDVMREFVVSEGFTFVKVVMALLCFSTVRISSGYRGLHEIISGTRVVGIRPVGRFGLFRRLARLWGSSSPAEGLPAQLGSYEVIGTLGGSKNVHVLEGHDQTLTRPVWLYYSPNSLDVENTPRAAVNRPTRQRWLESGEQAGWHWQAVESIAGGPIVGLLDSRGVIPWQAGCELLPALAEELLASIDDGTLPSQLTLGQLWLDGAGGLRLVDHPLWDKQRFAEDSDSTFSEIPEGRSDIERSWRLLKEVAARCRLDTATPGSAADYLGTLQDMPESKDELRGAIQSLRELSRLSYRLNWDNRLGIIAVSALVEFALVQAWIFVLAWYMADLMGYHLVPTMAASLLAAATLPAFLGFVYQGGLAFSLSEVESRVFRTRAVSRVRSAVRCVLAWLPVVVPLVIYRVVTLVMSEEVRGFQPHPERIILTVAWISVAIFISGLAILGTIFAIASPRRGIQDWLAGTYITRR